MHFFLSFPCYGYYRFLSSFFVCLNRAHPVPFKRSCHFFWVVSCLSSATNLSSSSSNESSLWFRRQSLEAPIAAVICCLSRCSQMQHLRPVGDGCMRMQVYSANRLGHWERTREKRLVARAPTHTHTHRPTFSSFHLHWEEINKRPALAGTDPLAHLMPKREDHRPVYSFARNHWLSSPRFLQIAQLPLRNRRQPVTLHLNLIRTGSSNSWRICIFKSVLLLRLPIHSSGKWSLKDVLILTLIYYVNKCLTFEIVLQMKNSIWQFWKFFLSLKV